MAEADYRLMTETTGQRIADALEDITAMQGPKGDKGDTGDTGPTGPKGDPGDDYVLTGNDKAEIAGIVEGEIIYNGLDKTASGFALDARQGKVLNDQFQALGLSVVNGKLCQTYTV